MKKFVSLFILLIMTCAVMFSRAEGVADQNVQMRVIKCKEWVSLRVEPDSKSERITEVPLNATVFDCEEADNQFIRCTYNGQTGYILAEYLETLRICLDWQQDACHVVASRSGDERQETLTVVCMVGDDDPVWTYTTTASGGGQYTRTAAFMGGTTQNPQVMILNSDRGLTMLELWDGHEKWTLGKETLDLGSGNCFTTDDATGIMYIAGAEGPDPVAISPEGKVLWCSETGNDEVFWPYSIEVRMDDIEVCYESGSIHEGYSHYSVVMDMGGNVEQIELVK